MFTGSRALPSSGLLGLLDVAAVRARLGVSRASVMHWIRTGMLPAHKLGTSWFVHQDDCRRPAPTLVLPCRFCHRAFTPKKTTKRQRTFCYADVCVERASRAR
jgi:hypothetical protein